MEVLIDACDSALRAVNYLHNVRIQVINAWQLASLTCSVKPRLRLMKERAALTAALASLNAKPRLYIKYATHTAAERDTPAMQCTSTTPVHGVGSVQNWVGQRKGLRMRTQLQECLVALPWPTCRHLPSPYPTRWPRTFSQAVQNEAEAIGEMAHQILPLDI